MNSKTIYKIYNFSLAKYSFHYCNCFKISIIKFFMMNV